MSASVRSPPCSAYHKPSVDRKNLDLSRSCKGWSTPHMKGFDQQWNSCGCRSCPWLRDALSPHELFPWEYAMKHKPPQTSGIALGCPRSCFRSVVRSHRAVMQWRQPCSIHLCDEHGCIQLVDAGGETTRRHEPRGVSGTLKVSPTGSIPHRENPAGKSPMTRSKPLGPSFASGSKHQREYGH